MRRLSYQHTIFACCIAYVVQSLVINFVPLLFVQFQKEFSVTLVELTGLVTLNFLIQLSSDALSIPIIKTIGYRMVALMAHVCSIVGFMAMIILPTIMSAYYGLVIATILYSIGGGLLEVVTNPIVEAIPTENSERMMSILHSFYSWGFVAITLITTVYFYIIGIENWRFLALLWTIVPLMNLIAFFYVPIPAVMDEIENSASITSVVSTRIFWIFALMMFCAGASEMALSQWLSLFMEQSVGLDKAIGDLAGPLSFAVMMGISRSFFGLAKHNLSVLSFIKMCLIGLLVSILMIALWDIPLISLVGSAIYGGAVGILWPGTYSLAAKNIDNSGPSMFGLLALVGDLGCALGPALIGYIASLFAGELQVGILSSLIFPILFFYMLYLAKRRNYL